jgi:hypothetical protein
MYRRDQHQNHSLSSYFDDRDESATTAPPVTTPVSPLATTVTIASPQSSRQQHVQPTAGEGVQITSQKYSTASIRATTEGKIPLCMCMFFLWVSNLLLTILLLLRLPVLMVVVSWT